MAAGGSVAGVYPGQVKAGERAREVYFGHRVRGGRGVCARRDGGLGRRLEWAEAAAGGTAELCLSAGALLDRSQSAQEAESGEATGRSFLGRRLRAAGVRGQYETKLTAASWIGEHVVEGRAVLPATGHLELMLEAGAEILEQAVCWKMWCCSRRW